MNWILERRHPKLLRGGQPKLVGPLPGTVSGIGDKRIIRMIQKWLKAGILEDGVVTVDDGGTGQGSGDFAAPCQRLPALLLLIFGLSAGAGGKLKATRSRRSLRRRSGGQLREHEGDARRFLGAIRERLGEFALSLHPDKTRLIEFDRFAAVDASDAGSANRRPCSSWASPSSAANRARDPFQLHRKTRRDRMAGKA